MPAHLKSALVREVARRGGNLNDVATGILAERFGVAHTPTGRKSALPGSAGVALLRMPAELKERIQTEAARTGSNANDVILRVLADELGIPFESNRRKDTMASANGSGNGKVRSEDKVRVAVIGVGNCANSLVQGVHYYRDADPGQPQALRQHHLLHHCRARPDRQQVWPKDAPRPLVHDVGQQADDAKRDNHPKRPATPHVPHRRDSNLAVKWRNQGACSTMRIPRSDAARSCTESTTSPT